VNQLEGLAQQHLSLKRQIADLQSQLDSINEQIASHAENNNEGAKTLTGESVKITVTHKTNRRLDLKAYNAIKDSLNIPEEYPIIQTKESLNESAFKKMEKDHPEWLQFTKDFVTVSQAKTAISVKLIED